MRSSLVITVVFGLISWVNAQADPTPVIDLNDLPQSAASASSQGAASTATSAPDPVAARQSLPMDQRVRLLEQQISNFTQMNLPAKVDNLEQQIHQLNGQIEEQTHTIQQLQDQLQKQPSANTAPSAASAVASAKDEKLVKHPVASSAATAEKVAQTDQGATTASPITAAETAVVQNKATAAPADEAGDENAQKAYQAAFDLMVKKKNTAAITAFKTFLKTYPTNTDFVPSAHYWLGELYSGSNKNALATKEFTTVIQQYPSHPKVSDAMLKLAIIHDDAGQHAQAKQELQKVIAKFPNSAAAKLAKMRLQSMKATA